MYAGANYQRMNPSPLTIQLFGPFRVLVDSEPMPRVRTRSVEWLLALLVLRHGRAVSRSWLAGTLWPESGESRALQNLRNDLVSLRKALGAEAARLSSPTRDTLTLDVNGADVDVIKFDTSIQSGEEARLHRAVAVYSGPLLEGCYEVWVQAERDTRAEQFLTALETLADYAGARDDHPEAIRFLRRAEALDSLRDSTTRRLMIHLAASGDPAAAIQTYRDFRLRLQRELLAEPDVETTRCFEAIRAGAWKREKAANREQGTGKSIPTAPSAGQNPPRTAHRAPSPTSLPYPLTRLIGREEEIEAVQERLRQSRLVTLVGGGGVGKTRLALEIAALAEEAATGDVCWVELEAIADSALLLSTFASALGIREESDTAEALKQRLAARLSNRAYLLAVDNCEHLLDGVAAMLQQLLSHCPRLRVLATSRQRLGVAGEAVWRVPSLPVPDTTQLPTDARDASEDALTYSAIRLFVERALAAQPEFQFASRQEIEAVCHICAQLDGIPLAIELAAARTAILPVTQIAGRLDDRFRLLTRGNRTALPRHQTLRALIDWSYNALSTEEKALLRQLAVFSGGWTLEAAETVFEMRFAKSGERQSEIENREVLDLIGSLTEKSLIHLEPFQEEPRYSLLVTVQHYALARLREADEEKTARDAHLHYYLALAEETDQSEYRPGHEKQVARLERDLFNLRAALAWAERRPDLFEAHLRLAIATRLLWAWRGRHREGIQHLQTALARRPDLRDAVRSKALIAAARLCEALARLEEARQLLDEAEPLLKELKDTWGQAERLRILCLIAMWERNRELSEKLAEESGQLFAQAGDDRMVALALLHRGRALRVLGQTALAGSLMQECLNISRREGNAMVVAEALHSLAHLSRDAGDRERSYLLLQESLELQRKLDCRFAIAFAQEELAELDSRQGRIETTCARLEEVARIWRESGMVKYLAECLNTLAAIAREMEDAPAAERYLAEAHSLAEA